MFLPKECPDFAMFQRIRRGENGTKTRKERIEERVTR
jgi:hypothetical protein